MTEETVSLSIATRFHREWLLADEPPDAEQFLRSHPDLPLRELTDVLLIDQRLRWQRGHPWQVEEYLRRVPALQHERELRMDLVYGEFLARRQLGQSPDVADFVTRFPDLEAELRKQVEFGAWMPALEQDSVAHQPREIGGLELVRPLGRGGMGEVFLARDRRLGRQVAVKMMRPGIAGVEIQNRRFENEVQVIARLDHPGIVPIYEVQLTTEPRYFTMKLMEGGSLLQHRSTFTRQPRLAAAVVAKIADAVHHAHQRGILHRDLKPSNVLLDAAGEPCVTDFGLARTLDHDSDLTGTHDLIGTPAYMSPEQADPQSGPITVATDVHGLGTILYWLLTGEPPFGTSTSVWTTLRQVRESLPLSPRQKSPRVPRDLETICFKALAKRPNERYASAQDLSDDLRRFLDGHPIAARPASWFKVVGHWTRRHPAWAALAGTILIAAGLLLGGLLAHNRQLDEINQKLTHSLGDAKRSEANAQTARKNAESAKAAALLAQATAQQSERRTREALYAADMLLADKARRSGDMLQFQILLARHTPVAFRRAEDANPPRNNTGNAGDVNPLRTVVENSGDLHPPLAELDDYRGFEWHYLSRFANTPVATLPPIKGRIHCVHFSHDGRLFAASGDDGHARLFDAPTRKELAVFSTTHRDVRSAIISPDGQSLATAGDDGAIVLWDIASRNQRWQTRAFSGRSWRLAFADGGKLLLSIGNEPLVKLWNVADGSAAGELTGHTTLVDSLAVSPDGRTAASGQGHGWVILWDIESRREISRFQAGLESIHALAFARTQPVLAAGGTDHSTALWDVSNPAEPRRLIRDEHLDEIRSLAFSPDDRQLALSDRSGAVRIWTFQSVEQAASLPNSNEQAGSLLHDCTHTTANIPAHRGRTESVAFSPDGRQLASGGLDGLVKFWNPNPVSPSRVLLDAPHDQFFDLALSRDGKSLVTAEVARVYLRDPENGDIRRWLTEIPERWGNVAISNDGQHVATASKEGTLLWWNLNSLDAQPQRLTDLDGINTLRFSPTEPLLGCARGHAKRVHFFRDGLESPPQDFIYPNCATLAFSPDGRQFSTDDMLGDVATLKWHHDLVGHLRSIYACEYHPHGHLIATGGSDRQVILWDAKTGTARHTLTGHRGFIQTLAFSPDGRSLVSADNQGIAKVWQVATGQELCELDLPAGSCDRLLFAPNGRSLYVLVNRRQVVVIDVSPTATGFKP